MPTTKWWMRRSPLECASRVYRGFFRVAQGIFCNETMSSKDVKSLKKCPPHPPQAVPLPRWGRLNTATNQNLKLLTDRDVTASRDSLSQDRSFRLRRGRRNPLSSRRVLRVFPYRSKAFQLSLRVFRCRSPFPRQARTRPYRI